MSDSHLGEVSGRIVFDFPQPFAKVLKQEAEGRALDAGIAYSELRDKLKARMPVIDDQMAHTLLAGTAECQRLLEANEELADTKAIVEAWGDSGEETPVEGGGWGAIAAVLKDNELSPSGMVELFRPYLIGNVKEPHASVWATGWSCGHAVLSRQCKGCSRRFCAECQPGERGTCPKCEGPVWADHVPQPPEVRNPKLKGY